ncbi:PREDICTED: UPF0725 protein At5g63820-like [Camelina sativa]|uniref:UPF0725 protein At5g63820-like n=1 Tax=Camelina sativa TaxID=90675 RepID=A0ABM0UMR7_CAMSA|nr:PREDICTED: UPF0725 protein At5g63820-like [Camelina sativa]
MEAVVEVGAACEFGKLEIARTSTARRRRKKSKTGLKRNGQLAYGFDFRFDLDGLVTAPQLYDYDCTLYARLGLYCYNFEKGTNLKFVRWEKYNSMCTSYYDVYLTLHAMDPACNSVFPFHTLLSNAHRRFAKDYVIDTWQILACRPACNKRVSEYWDRDQAMDTFYKRPMPTWLSDEALATDSKKYYVVQEADLHENDWLHLFTEIAFFSIARAELEASPPLEINKLVVETKEDYITEAREKLHAKNAIFYISYKYRGDPSIGFTGDHRAIIRKTMDGEPEHMCLEIASERQAK